MDNKSERKSNAKVTALREIEQQVQQSWKNDKIFEEDAPQVCFVLKYFLNLE